MEIPLSTIFDLKKCELSYFLVGVSVVNLR